MRVFVGFFPFNSDGISEQCSMVDIIFYIIIFHKIEKIRIIILYLAVKLMYIKNG